MAIKQAQYQITINTFDVSATIAPWLISINLEDTFDTDLTVSKLQLNFHAKYRRSINWRYKDQLKVILWWSDNPSVKFTSNIFYIDYIEDVKESGGNQTFEVSALEADPTIGYQYAADSIVLTNKTIKQALIDFTTAYGMTLVQNVTDNVYMGTTDLTTITGDVKATFNSYSEMLLYICQRFGYYADVSGKQLTVIKIDTDYTLTRYYLPPLDLAISINYKQSYNDLNKEYYAKYISGSSSVDASVQPAMSSRLNNKVKKLDYDEAYKDFTTAAKRLEGEVNLDFFKGFEMNLNVLGDPSYVGGGIFLLDATYGASEGFYRCTRVTHRIDGKGWISEVVGFPQEIVRRAYATFYVGYWGQTKSPFAGSTVTITQTIAGLLTTYTATQINAFIRTYNADYSEYYLELGTDLGALYVQEANKVNNSIRLDIAIAQMMTETDNLTASDTYNFRNPGGIGTASSATTLNSFSDWTTGVRAHIQHMFAFAKATGTPADTIVDPRYSSVTRGSATTVDALQNKWNTKVDYSNRIKSKLKAFHQYFNPGSLIVIS